MFFKQVSRSLLVKFLGMLFSLYTVRLQLHYLGDDSYATWAVIFNIVNWILILDFGLGNSIRNQLVDSIGEQNWDKCSSLISKVYGVSAFFGFTFILVFFILNLYIQIMGYKVHDLFAINFVVLSFIFVFFMLPINQVLHSFSKSDVVIIIQTLITISSLLFIIFFRDNINLNILSAIYGLSTIFVYFIVSFIFYKRQYQLKLKLSLIRLDGVLDIIKSGFIYFVFQIYVILIFSTDRVFVANLLGTDSVVSYDILMRFFNLFIVVSVMFNNPIWSEVRKVSDKDFHSHMKPFFLKLLTIQVTGIFLLFLMSIFSEIFISLWIGKELLFSYDTILYFALLSWVYSYYSLMANISNGLGDNRAQLLIGLFSVVLKVPLTLFVFNFFVDSVNAIVISTFICLLPFPLYFTYYLAFRRFK